MYHLMWMSALLEQCWWRGRHPGRTWRQRLVRWVWRLGSLQPWVQHLLHIKQRAFLTTCESGAGIITVPQHVASVNLEKHHMQ